MPSIRYKQLDVFAARHGGGNPLGVVIDAEGWSDARMQRFAHWTNLVETTFLLPARAEGADYRARIFTPTKEIPFAGHPTIGSAHAALDAGLIRADAAGIVWQECGAGVLPIRVEGEGPGRELFVQSPKARVVGDASHGGETLSAVLYGVKRGVLPPACVEGGRRWWIAEFADEAELRGWRPDHAAIRALAMATDTLGLCVFARSADGIAVRAFPAGVGIVEDPASGAANGLIAAYIAQCDANGPLARGYLVSQGREVGHDARIIIRIDGDAVWVGGRTNTIIDGHVDWQDL
ncbi:phenazine biosynthesis protein PhzF family [Luteibacter sp. UNC138MFCol5.1]|uniref:PhzF family phenazine biosynthesis protein n=1 Tax=Luteibacter sp. UNC138MFCol5.1 TaxID=1502774 RepID=UPI0008B3BAEE|nr:PhzF family phenazine biosynthesis protein [Luteibacter sp. UNC138MFCol5.1]SEO54340.1 phenazine biosynthesis protein PhzF family [Luteibacter sp. UNC138MFCol5.1]